MLKNVYSRGVGGQKRAKFGIPSFWTPPSCKWNWIQSESDDIDFLLRFEFFQWSQLLWCGNLTLDGLKRLFQSINLMY